MDDFRAELMAAFAAELAENMAAIRVALADADAGRTADLREFSRRAHSLKGAARAVDLPTTEAAAHELEAIILAVERGERRLGPAEIAELKTLADAIEDGARQGEPVAADADEPDRRLAIAGRHVERLGQSLHLLAAEVAEQGSLDDELNALAEDLAALIPIVARGGDADATRRTAQASTAVDRIRRTHRRLHDGLDRSSAELERDGERLMLQPVAALFEGHERMVRELAAAEGKAVSLSIPDVEGEADRRVLNALRDPLLHLLRNAVRHGIETPDHRRNANKTPEGAIAIEAAISRGRLNLVIRDDGRGLDEATIDARARAAGLIAPDSPRPPRGELFALLFEQGFSTADRLDEIAGRGIGLSVVAETARRLHGTASIRPGTGGGTLVRLSVPLSLTRQTLLLVEVGGATYAIPSAATDRVCRVLPTDLDRSGGNAVLVVDDEPLPVMHLADLIGVSRAATDGAFPAVVVDADGQRRVVAVDALHDVRAVLVGDPTAIAADVPMIFGTILIDGGVVLVLDPVRLVRGRAGAATLTVATPSEAQRRRTILVVDDSITTRTLERSILEAQGYRVLIDVDGMAGLERLRSGLEEIDLVVADVEMPRMDGFGLLTAIRNDPALQSLPVVMMTSRNSPDDIERGLSLGASAYVTKQDFDQGTLISVVQQLI